MLYKTPFNCLKKQSLRHRLSYCLITEEPILLHSWSQGKWKCWISRAMKEHQCGGLNKKCSPRAYAFAHLVPGCWYCMGRLWNIQEVQPCWKKYYTVSLFLVLWRFNITQTKDIWERMSALNMYRLLNKNPQTMQRGGSLHCTRYSSNLEMLYIHGRVYANMTPFYIRDLRLVCLWGLDPGTNPL